MAEPVDPDIVQQIDRGLASPDQRAKLRAGILLQRLLIHEGPERAWPLVERWGTADDVASRRTIAEWALSPLLDKHFDRYFGLAEQLALNNPRFAELLLASFDYIDGFRRADRIAVVRRRLLDAGVKAWPEASERPTLGDILDEEDPDLFADDLREYLLGLEEPSDAEMAALQVLMLCLEASSGGIYQFLFNSAGNEANATIAALRRIGALAHAQLLQEAIAAFGPPGPATDIDARRRQIEGIGEAGRRAWRALDERYQSVAADLVALLRDYIRASRSEFGDESGPPN
jgi:hypothetical protein